MALIKTRHPDRHQFWADRPTDRPTDHLGTYMAIYGLN
jgi:hypothetical protein